MKTLTPAHPGMRSKVPKSSAFSGVAPTKKAWSTRARPRARRNFSSKAWAVVVEGSGLPWGPVGVLALWAVAGLGLAARFFRWE